MSKRIVRVALPVAVVSVIAAVTIGAAGPCDIMSLLDAFLG